MRTANSSSSQRTHVHEGTDPFQVQHPAGDELSRVDMVVEGEVEMLELVVERHPQPVGEMVARGFHRNSCGSG